MSIRLTGLKELERQFEELRQRAESMSGEQSVPLTDLLTPDFLAACSTFSSADEMFERSGFSVESQKDFAAIPDDAWDAFIRANTSYFSWKEMLDAAGAAWAKGKLGF
jgi:hypothetical protein